MNEDVKSALSEMYELLTTAHKNLQKLDLDKQNDRDAAFELKTVCWLTSKKSKRWQEVIDKLDSADIQSKEKAVTPTKDLSKIVEKTSQDLSSGKYGKLD